MFDVSFHIIDVFLFVISSKSLAFFQESFISFQVIVSKETKFEFNAEAGHTTSQLQADNTFQAQSFLT